MKRTFVIGHFQANMNTIKMLANRDTGVVTITEATQMGNTFPVI